jgi:hypothetical protein
LMSKTAKTHVIRFVLFQTNYHHAQQQCSNLRL